MKVEHSNALKVHFCSVVTYGVGSISPEPANESDYLVRESNLRDNDVRVEFRVPQRRDYLRN